MVAATEQVPRRGPSPLLLSLVVLLSVAVVLGGVLAWDTQRRRDADAAAQQRYGDVLASATAEAEAFVNLRHDDARAGVDRVAAGATGEFRERYTEAGDRVVAALERNRSVLAGDVLWAGVVDLDGDRATVIAATSGTVTSRRTEGVPLPRDFQLRLELVLEDGRWLTRDLRFVR